MTNPMLKAIEQMKEANSIDEAFKTTASTAKVRNMFRKTLASGEAYEKDLVELTKLTKPHFVSGQVNHERKSVSKGLTSNLNWENRWLEGQKER